MVLQLLENGEIKKNRNTNILSESFPNRIETPEGVCFKITWPIRIAQTMRGKVKISDTLCAPYRIAAVHSTTAGLLFSLLNEQNAEVKAII